MSNAKTLYGYEKDKESNVIISLLRLPLIGAFLYTWFQLFWNVRAENEGRLSYIPEYSDMSLIVALIALSLAVSWVMFKRVWDPQITRLDRTSWNLAAMTFIGAPILLFTSLITLLIDFDMGLLLSASVIAPISMAVIGRK